ncbi:hypothetical protein AB0G87_31455 [Streptomyces asoensis]|uniref:hypothetical protein n=1 Tax=Streptomyces asoensis TaxID=249586 RepID=UPI0033E5013F
MLHHLPVFTRTARAAVRDNFTGAVVVVTLLLGSWSMAAAGAPTEQSTGPTTLYAGDVGWNVAQPGAAA